MRPRRRRALLCGPSTSPLDGDATASARTNHHRAFGVVATLTRYLPDPRSFLATLTPQTRNQVARARGALNVLAWSTPAALHALDVVSGL